jgi:hypothetical protein
MARKSRRARGEGTLFRDGDGRWVARLRVGSRVRVKKARTQRECADWLADLRRQVAGGVDVNDTSTVAEYLEHWLSVARAGLRHNTWVLHSQVVRDHVAPSSAKCGWRICARTMCSGCTLSASLMV